MVKNKYLPLLAALCVGLAFGWYFLWSASTPKGQPPLASLTPGNTRGFANEFNQAAANARMVLLLSPT
ncbi:MAG TPA: hypothetical protein VEG68_16120 [Terriglobales bacterium]|nr:hypothetical protein [Terriglobales bacterium]